MQDGQLFFCGIRQNSMDQDQIGLKSQSKCVAIESKLDNGSNQNPMVVQIGINPMDQI